MAGGQGVRGEPQMKPLSVALVVRDEHKYRERVGWWSYPVDEFTWTQYPVIRSGFKLDRDELARKHEVIFWDDWTTGEFTGSKIPVINLVVDGSHARRLANRRSMAAQSDLILVDSAPLELFEGLDRPIRRLAYCVNNHLYKPDVKTVDVAYWCWK